MYAQFIINKKNTTLYRNIYHMLSLCEFYRNRFKCEAVIFGITFKNSLFVFVAQIMPHLIIIFDRIPWMSRPRNHIMHVGKAGLRMNDAYLNRFWVNAIDLQPFCWLKDR